MIGVALEGGGARGAYHVGVIKAYLENGIRFDGFVGTSIGAFNAAILAQGDFKKLYKLWSNLSQEEIFDVDAKNLLQLTSLKFSVNVITNLKGSMEKVIGNGGVDTSKMEEIIRKQLNEKKLRASKKDYGLVTVSLNDHKTYELFIEDIPERQLLHYIMASASFPGFKPQIIDGKPYLDGGLSNNCPINMLLEKGYDEIIAIRTFAQGVYRKVSKNQAKITVIEPSADLGNMMSFSNELCRANIEMGYYDGLRAIHHLKGKIYYVKPSPKIDFGSKFMGLPREAILEIGNILGVSGRPSQRLLFEQILPKIGTYLKLGKEFNYEDLTISILEHFAVELEIKRYHVYELSELLLKVKEKLPDEKKIKENLFIGKNRIVIYKLLKELIRKS